MRLDKLIVPVKEATFEYPGMEGFNVVLCYHTRDELMKLRKKAVVNKFDKKLRASVEEVDAEIFQDIYIKAVLRGWSGFKLKYVAKLLPLNLNGEDEESELEYTTDDAVMLMKNSSDFDNWVTSQLEDLENFTTKK